MSDGKSYIDFKFGQLLELTGMCIGDDRLVWGNVPCKIDYVGAEIYQMNLHMYRVPIPAPSEIVRLQILESNTVWDSNIQYNKTSITGHILVNFNGHWIETTEEPSTIEWLPGDFSDLPINRNT